MLMRADQVKVGNQVYLTNCKQYKRVTDVRFNPYPRTADNKSMLVSLQAGPHIWTVEVEKEVSVR